MQKKIMICLVLLIVVINVIILANPIKESKENKDNSLISMNLQDEEGNYFETKNINFNEEGYHFNKRKSNCEGGSELSWQDGKLQVTADKTDKCHVYLDNNNFVEDLSGNGNHGVVPSSVVWYNDGVAINDNSIISPLTINQLSNKFSFVIRFKIDQLDLETSYQYRLICGNDYYISFFLRFSSNGIHPYFQTYYKESSHDGANGKNININEFYTLVGIYDYSNKIIAFYNNGIKEDENPITDLKINIDNKFVLNNGYTFSDVLIFDRVLTEEEIARDYANEINPTNKQNLLLWYKFD